MNNFVDRWFPLMVAPSDLGLITGGLTADKAWVAMGRRRWTVALSKPVDLDEVLAAALIDGQLMIVTVDALQTVDVFGTGEQRVVAQFERVCAVAVANGAVSLAAVDLDGQLCAFIEVAPLLMTKYPHLYMRQVSTDSAGGVELTFIGADVEKLGFSEGVPVSMDTVRQAGGDLVDGKWVHLVGAQVLPILLLDILDEFDASDLVVENGVLRFTSSTVGGQELRVDIAVNAYMQLYMHTPGEGWASVVGEIHNADERLPELVRTTMDTCPPGVALYDDHLWLYGHGVCLNEATGEPVVVHPVCFDSVQILAVDNDGLQLSVDKFYAQGFFDIHLVSTDVSTGSQRMLSSLCVDQLTVDSGVLAGGVGAVLLQDTAHMAVLQDGSAKVVPLPLDNAAGAQLLTVRGEVYLAMWTPTVCWLWMFTGDDWVQVAPLDMFDDLRVAGDAVVWSTSADVHALDLRTLVYFTPPEELHLQGLTTVAERPVYIDGCRVSLLDEQLQPVLTAIAPCEVVRVGIRDETFLAVHTDDEGRRACTALNWSV